MLALFFFFNDTATTEIYTLSLHDALPISFRGQVVYVDFWASSSAPCRRSFPWMSRIQGELGPQDRKSTRLNSSHSQISYAVFCLKKKNKLIYLGLLVHLQLYKTRVHGIIL